MSAYMLLCNFTDQGVRTIKEVRSAERPHKSWAKNLALISKPAISPKQPMTSPSMRRALVDAMAKFLLSLASKGTVRTTTVKVFSQEESDKILAAVV